MPSLQNRLFATSSYLELYTPYLLHVCSFLSEHIFYFLTNQTRTKRMQYICNYAKSNNLGTLRALLDYMTIFGYKLRLAVSDSLHTIKKNKMWDANADTKNRYVYRCTCTKFFLTIAALVRAVRSVSLLLL